MTPAATLLARIAAIALAGDAVPEATELLRELTDDLRACSADPRWKAPINAFRGGSHSPAHVMRLIHRLPADAALTTPDGMTPPATLIATA